MAQGGFLIVLAVMFAVFYMLIVRPQKARQRAHQAQLDSVEPGDEVVTVGGIYGDVIEVQDDRIVLEIAEDVHIEVARRAISSIVKADQREDLDDDTGEAGELEAADEDGDVTAEADATSEAERAEAVEPEPAPR